MAATLSPVFNDAQLDGNGDLLSGGRIWWTVAGTTTPQDTYTNNLGSSNAKHSNPVILNARGEAPFPIYLGTGLNYDAVLEDATGTVHGAVIRTIEDIKGVNDVIASTPYLGFFNSTPTVAPTGTATNSMALGSGAIASGVSSIAIGFANASGTESIAMNISNNGGSFGATGNYAVAIGFNAKASGANFSTVIGGSTNAATGAGCTVVGGSTNTASSSSYGTILGGFTNTASGSFATIVGGTLNTAAGTKSIVAGGESNTVSAQCGHAGILGGLSNTVVQAGGGQLPLYAAILGGRNVNVKRTGMIGFGAGSAAGKAQAGSLVAEANTPDATPVVMKINALHTITVESGTFVQFRIMVCGMRTDVIGDGGAYEFSGLIANVAGTTALVGSVTKTVVAESNAAWDVGVTANNTNDCIDITVTGVAAQTIQWAARVDLVEIGVV